MTTRPINLTDWQVRAALDGRLSLVVEPVMPEWEETVNREFSGWRPERIGNREWVLVGGFTIGARITSRRATGDRLWAREAWRPSISAADPWHVAVLYPNDGKVRHWGWSSDDDFGDWIIPKAAAKGNVSSQIMPRWASRLTLIVTDVKVMRAQEIGDVDANKAGLKGFISADGQDGVSPREDFQDAWNTRHAKRGLGWDANPWVTATTVTVHRCNINQM